jgi:hypothetical protein
MNATNESKDTSMSLRNLTRACGAVCQKVLNGIRQAKAELLVEYQSLFVGHERSLRLALSEAESLAWQTDFPHLFFPDLAMEKVQVLADRERYQRAVPGRTTRNQLAA